MEISERPTPRDWAMVFNHTTASSSDVRVHVCLCSFRCGTISGTAAASGSWKAGLSPRTRFLPPLWRAASSAADRGCFCFCPSSMVYRPDCRRGVYGARSRRDYRACCRDALGARQRGPSPFSQLDMWMQLSNISLWLCSRRSGMLSRSCAVVSRMIVSGAEGRQPR
jgi:hypothetical protein